MQWTGTIWKIHRKAQEMNIVAKFQQIWPSGFRGSDWKVDDRRTLDHWLAYGNLSFPEQNLRWA